MSGWPQTQTGAYGYGLTAINPSGDTTGATDTLNLKTARDVAAVTGGTVIPTPGTYYINQPVVFGPSGTNGGAVPAVGLCTFQANGRVGDYSFPADKSAVEFVATASFPIGSFMFDWQQTPGAAEGPGGAAIGGFSVECNNRSAGVRIQGARGFRGDFVTVTYPAAPVSPGDSANGGFSVSALASAPTAGFANEFRHIMVYGGAADGIWHNIPGPDTFIDCYSFFNSGADYHVYTNSFAKWIGCDYYGGVTGWQIEAGSNALVIGSMIIGQGLSPTGNAVVLVGGDSAPPGYMHTRFVACQIMNDPGASPTEEAGAVICIKANGPYIEQASFSDCEIGAQANTSDWIYCEAGVNGTVDFNDCVFNGTPTTHQYNDLTGGVVNFDNCRGITPTAANGLLKSGLIQKVTLGADGTITFSGIPQGYTKLKVVVQGRSDSAAEFDSWFVTINAIATGYDFVGSGANFTSNTFFLQQSNVTGWYPSATSDLPGSTATAKVSGWLELELFNYASTAFNVTGRWESGYNDAATAAADAQRTSGSLAIRAAAAVTSITIGSVNGSSRHLAAGAVACLYGEV